MKIDCTFRIWEIATWVIGFGLTFLFIMWREKKAMERENRQINRDLQGWFEDTFILNGLEQVLAYFTNILQTNVIESNAKHFWNPSNPRISEPEFPRIALIRIYSILRETYLSELVSFVRLCAYHPHLKKDDHTIIDSFPNTVEDLLTPLVNELHLLIGSIREFEISDKQIHKNNFKTIRPNIDNFNVLIKSVRDKVQLIAQSSLSNYPTF